MFLSQISCDFWMKCCHLQELGPQGQEVGAKPGEVLAYLFCYLLWVAQQLQGRKGFLRTRQWQDRKSVSLLDEVLLETKTKSFWLRIITKALFYPKSCKWNFGSLKSHTFWKKKTKQLERKKIKMTMGLEHLSFGEKGWESCYCSACRGGGSQDLISVL